MTARARGIGLNKLLIIGSFRLLTAHVPSPVHVGTSDRLARWRLCSGLTDFEVRATRETRGICDVFLEVECRPKWKKGDQ